MKAFILLLVSMSLVFPMAVRGEVMDRVVAIVNDDIITLKEVEKYVHVERQSRFSSVDEYVRNLQLRDKLDVFVENLLIIQQAKKMKLDVQDKEVDGYVKNIKKKNLITDNELLEQLKKENISYKDFVDGIRRSMLRSKVIARATSQQVLTDDKQLKQFYDAHQEEYRQEEFRIRHIFISTQRKDGAERAHAAFNLLVKGKAFDEVAREYSDEPTAAQGGDIGYVKKEELIPDLLNAIKLLVPGSHSNIIRTGYGFHILQLVDAKKGEVVPFDDVKEKIRDRIVQDASEKRYKEYIKKLREASYIEVKI